MNAVDFIYLERSWTVDALHLEKKLGKIKRTAESLTIVLFPEGTTLCEEAIMRSHKYIREKTQLTSQFENVLLPKSTGLFHVIQHLDSSFRGILDVTVSYCYSNGKSGKVSINSTSPDGSRMFLESFFSISNMVLKGIWPTDVYIDVQWIPRANIPLDNIETFTTWLYSRFERKELLLLNDSIAIDDESNYSYHGPFIAPTYRVTFICIMLTLVYGFSWGFLQFLAIGLSFFQA